MKTAYTVLGTSTLVALLGLGSALRSSSAYGSRAVAWAVGLFLIGINDVGAGDLAAAEPPRGLEARRRWRALLYRSEVYALGQNLWRYFIAQGRGLHHTEIDLRKAGTLDPLPASAASRMVQDYTTNSLPFFAARLEQGILRVSAALYQKEE